MTKWISALMAAMLLLLCMGGMASAESASGVKEWMEGAIDSASTLVAPSGELEVRANAARMVTPDTATLRVGVSVEEKTEGEAQARANEVINRTTEALKALGLEDKQIVTSGYNITRKYNHYSKLSQIEGYIARITLTVTVGDFDLINQVIDAAVAQGANDIGNIQFSYSKEGEVYREALKDAIRVARAKAEDMADAAGVTLHTLLNLSENSGYNTTYYNTVEMEEAPGAAMESGSTQIMAGDIEISASVWMKYQIK